MELFIPFSASLLAVADSFAGTLNVEDILLVAKLTLSNSLAALFNVLVGELRRAYFNDDHLVVEVMILHCDQCAHVGLKRLTWESNSRIFL